MSKEHRITVNFNNIRRQAMIALDKLTTKLNQAVTKPAAVGDWVTDYGYISKGDIVINASDIENEMNDLRMLVGTIGACYEEGNPEYADIYGELYPEEGDCMVVFNDEQD